MPHRNQAVIVKAAIKKGFADQLIVLVGGAIDDIRDDDHSLGAAIANIFCPSVKVIQVILIVSDANAIFESSESAVVQEENLIFTDQLNSAIDLVAEFVLARSCIPVAAKEAAAS